VQIAEALLQENPPYYSSILSLPQYLAAQTGSSSFSISVQAAQCGGTVSQALWNEVARRVLQGAQ